MAKAYCQRTTISYQRADDRKSSLSLLPEVIELAELFGIDPALQAENLSLKLKHEQTKTSNFSAHVTRTILEMVVEQVKNERGTSDERTPLSKNDKQKLTQPSEIKGLVKNQEDEAGESNPPAEYDRPKKTKEARRNRNGIELTDEQNHAVDVACQGADAKTEAFAGTGKTTLLTFVGQELAPKRGLYLAFNRAIAEEAKEKFPGNVECRTAHSLAFRAVGRHYKDRLQKVNGRMVAEELNLSDNDLLSKYAQGNLALDVVRKFCHSSNKKIGKVHIPKAELWDRFQSDGDVNACSEVLIDAAEKLWKVMTDKEKEFPITHDVYLKLWALSKPSLEKDFILFDECQDANPVLLDLVNSQSSQKIWVGDRFQQIYSWRGAVNAMDTIRCSNATQITKCFRFGPAIAEQANYVLNKHLGIDVNLKGNESLNSTVKESENLPNVYLARTNSELLSTLTTLSKKNIKAKMTGSIKETIYLLKAASLLKQGRSTNHKDLSIFQTWNEVVEFSETQSGMDMKPLVTLIENSKVEDLISTLKESERIKRSDMDIELSTAHKAKGKEWDYVCLANDYKYPGSRGYSQEETNLLYVACTRGLKNLDISSCYAANFDPDGEGELARA